MYEVKINDKTVATFNTFEKAQIFANHCLIEEQLNEFGYETIVVKMDDVLVGGR